MNVWAVERLRLTRTGRWAPVLGVFVFFGVLSPIIAKYQEKLFGRAAGGRIRIIVPSPTPADGVQGFMGNAQQFGLLAVVIIAAGAFAFDAKPELSAFFRTRVRRVAGLVVPKFVANSALAALSFIAGIVAASVLTVILIGSLPVGRLVVAGALWCLYLVFAVATVALAAGLVRTQLATVFVALAVLIALGVAGQFHQVARWLPSDLVGSTNALLSGGAVSRYVRPAVVTVLATPAVLLAAVRLLQRREL